MLEAMTDPVEDGRTVLELAAELEITVIASASLLQARLSRHLPAEIAQMLPGLTRDAQRAIQFARSTPGITSAVVGMADTAHVAENLAAANVPPLTPAEHQRFCCKMSSVLSS
jgi:aryl-alcohol dehydrogenase-like predicted oxidoreductase